MGIFYPAAGSDDGTVNDGVFNTSWEGMYFGQINADLFVCFPNVTIPNGVYIKEAYVQLTSFSNGANLTCDVNIYFNDVDNAVAPTSLAELNALALTGAVNWSFTEVWANYAEKDTPELKTILQTIVDRAGWTSGNAVTILIKENSSTDQAVAITIEKSGGIYKAELHIVWGIKDAEIVTTIPSLTADIRGGGYLDFIVPSLEAFLRPAPFIVAEMPNFNAAIHGEQDVIYGDIAVSVPALVASISEYPYGGIETELPALTAALHYLNTGDISSAIPSLTADMSASISAQVEAELPMLTLSMLGGARNEPELPALTTEMEGLVGKVGNVDVDIPSLTLEMEGKVGYLGDIDVNLPILVAACNGNIGKVAGVSATLPSLESDLKGWAEPGEREIRATMPSLEAIAFLKSDNRFDSCPGWKYG